MAFLRAAQGGGSGYSRYSLVYDNKTNGTSFTLSNMSGKKLLVFCYMIYSANLPYARYDEVAVTGATKTKLGNLHSSNATSAGTFFTFNVTSNTCTITHANSFRVMAFEAE